MILEDLCQAEAKKKRAKLHLIYKSQSGIASSWSLKIFILPRIQSSRFQIILTFWLSCLFEQVIIPLPHLHSTEGNKLRNMQKVCGLGGIISVFPMI